MTDQPDSWHWYASGDAEIYPIGPCESRVAVIRAAMADGCFSDFDDDNEPIHSFYVVEACKREIRLADHIEVDQLLEAANDSVWSNLTLTEDEETFFDASAEQQADLQARIRAACDDWQAAHGLTFIPRTFADTRNEARVTVPAGATDEDLAHV